VIKALFYIVFALIGIVAGLVSPVAGAASSLLAYLANPPIIVGDLTSFRFQLLLTLAFIVGCIVHRGRGLEKVGREGLVLKLIWSFAALALLSSTWAVYSSEQAVNAIWEVIKTLLMCSLMVRVIRSEKDMRWLIIACLIGILHASIAHTFGIRFGYVSSSYSRSIGVLPDAQRAVLVLFIPMLVLTAILAKRKIDRLLSCVILPFALNSVISTYERTGFVSLAVELIGILLFVPKRIVMRLIPVVAGGLLLFVFFLAPDDYWTKVSTIENPHEEASANSRFAIGEASWQMLNDYPMGVGYRNYPDVSPRYLSESLLTDGRRSAHNSFFSVACETGLIGFTLWISAFAGTIWLCRRIRKKSRLTDLSLTEVYAMGIEIGLYGWLAGGFFQADHEADPAYWFIAFAVILTRLHEQSKKSADNPEEPEAALELESVTR
jgi:O-antigen ligase